MNDIDEHLYCFPGESEHVAFLAHGCSRKILMPENLYRKYQDYLSPFQGQFIVFHSASGKIVSMQRHQHQGNHNFLQNN
jgi:hypothetical protein